MSETTFSVSVDEVAARFGELARLHRHHRHAPPWMAQELTFSQVRVLFLLREHGPVSITALARSLGVTAPTASGVVDRLERHGLVERRHRQDDRRVVECALSERGKRLVREMAGARFDAIRRSLAVLDPEELATFDRLLGLISERLAKASPS